MPSQVTVECSTRFKIWCVKQNRTHFLWVENVEDRSESALRVCKNNIDVLFYFYTSKIWQVVVCSESQEDQDMAITGLHDT